MDNSSTRRLAPDSPDGVPQIRLSKRAGAFIGRSTSEWTIDIGLTKPDQSDNGRGITTNSTTTLLTERPEGYEQGLKYQ